MSKPDQDVTVTRDPQPTQVLDSPDNDLLDIDIESISSPALTRLIEEVRNDADVGRAYNRTYHRHNR